MAINKKNENSQKPKFPGMLRPKTVQSQSPASMTAEEIEYENTQLPANEPKLKKESEKPKEENKKINDKKNPKNKKTDDKPSITTCKEEKTYNGPRTIMVYGESMYIEEDLKATDETIRQKLVDDFGRLELSKERTVFSFDKETGILCVGIKYKDKG